MKFGWLLEHLKATAPELASHELESLFDGVLQEAELLKDEIIRKVEQERADLTAKIEEHTREVAHMDYLLEINRLRAARVHELVARLKEEVDGRA